jgi:hypothetical protein
MGLWRPQAAARWSVIRIVSPNSGVWTMWEYRGTSCRSERHNSQTTDPESYTYTRSPVSGVRRQRPQRSEPAERS